MATQNLIWIEPNIESEEYQEYEQQLESVKNKKTFTEVEKGIDEIFKIKFEDTIIIIGGEIMDDFFRDFSNKIDQLHVVPKLMIFSGEEKKKEILKNKKKYQSYPFFNIKFVFDDFSLVKNEVLKDDVSDYFLNDSRFSFEFVESEEQLSILVNYYKIIVLAPPPQEKIRKFNQFLYEKFKTKVVSIFKLLRNTFVNHIPQKLLIKYWLRLYSIPDFSKLMNDNLQKGTSNEFGIYSQLLYIGLYKNLIQPYINTKLYRGGIITKDELKKIKSFKKRKDDFHGYTCYTKIFISFTTEKDIALDFINQNKNNLKFNEKLVLFEIEEGNEKMDGVTATNTNIEEYSINPENKEILFFPYSCFEITEISNDDEAYTNIKLQYFGKYKDQVPEDINEMKDIPECQFVKDFLSSQVCSKEGLEDLVEENPKIFTFDHNKYIKNEISEEETDSVGMNNYILL
jgi:hypothetical protein